MAVSYLHGVEMINVQKGIRPISVVRSSVIGLIGIAPKGATNSLISVLSPTDAAQFGDEVPGFSIPQALNAIYKQTPTAVLVINVFNPATMVTAVTTEAHTLTAGKLQLTFSPIGLPTTINVFASDGTTQLGGSAGAWVYGTDYTFDSFGNFTALSTVPVNGTVYKFTYNKLNAGAVTNSLMIGGYDDTLGRTGMALWDTAYNTFGYKPKILIAPNYSSVNAIAAQLQVYATKYKACTFFDAPASTTRDTAIAGRGPAGTINFNYSDTRVGLLYPLVKAFDAYTNADQVRPWSAYMAGLVAKTDINEGYWVSPSNHPILGLTGIERNITWDITDNTGTTDANQLNQVGIITLANGFGTGIRSWGNSSSAWPASTDPTQFLSVQRTRDVVEESIEYAMLPFIDGKIDRPVVDSVVESVNVFIRSLIAKGALIDGSVCTFDPSLNSDAELALGHVVFSLVMMPPTPMQRITFNSSIDISLLKSLLSTTQAA
jgi:hypothetical protein